MKKARCLALVGGMVCAVSASAQTEVTYTLVDDGDCDYHIEVEITGGYACYGLALWSADVVWVTGAAGAQMVDLGRRVQNRRRTAQVHPLHRGDTFGKRGAAGASVRRSPHHAAEVNMTGGG